MLSKWHWLQIRPKTRYVILKKQKLGRGGRELVRLVQVVWHRLILMID
jgi:hypothetical protein